VDVMAETALWRESERRRLVRLCATISGDRDAAEDLAQETLLEAWRSRHKLTDPAGADRWLSAVARNVCLRWTTRRARREVAVPDVPEEAGELVLDRDDLAEILDGALALLPPSSREVLLQRYVQERPVTEIARRLGISDEAVSMRLARGKLALRRALGEEEWRRTAIWCVGCGAHALVMRRERDGSAVAFRCPGCDGEAGRSAVFPLDNPFFAELVGSLERPTAMFGRLAGWARSYWAGGDGSPAACTRCGGETTVRSHTRLDLAEPTAGLYVRCSRCGEELWSSLVGITMALPDVRAIRRREPRTVATVATGREAVVVRFGAVETAFEQPSFRLRGAC
jgi:RNA polymerase sigma-70 factor (ECF subfamily)